MENPIRELFIWGAGGTLFQKWCLPNHQVEFLQENFTYWCPNSMFRHRINEF